MLSCQTMPMNLEKEKSTLRKDLEKSEDEYQEIYSKVILIKSEEMDLNTMIGKSLTLEIDAAYTIGKSIAVLSGGKVIGHLTRYAARPVWIQLHSGCPLTAKIYDQLGNGFKNCIQYSMLTRSFEVGITLQFHFKDALDGGRRISASSDAKFFLSYVLRHRLNCFPGVTLSNCPPELKHFF